MATALLAQLPPLPVPDISMEKFILMVLALAVGWPLLKWTSSKLVDEKEKGITATSAALVNLAAEVKAGFKELGTQFNALTLAHTEMKADIKTLKRDLRRAEKRNHWLAGEVHKVLGKLAMKPSKEPEPGEEDNDE